MVRIRSVGWGPAIDPSGRTRRIMYRIAAEFHPKRARGPGAILGRAAGPPASPRPERFGVPMSRPDPAQRPVLVFDFGSQYVQLIARRVRERHTFARIVRHDIAAERVRALDPLAL